MGFSFFQRQLFAENTTILCVDAGLLLLELSFGGRVIARRSNMARPHGLCNRGFHAEERLLKCCDEKVVRGSTVVIVRTNTKGFLSAMSRPCDVCYSLLKKAGVRKIVYIDWDRNVSTERV